MAIIITLVEPTTLINVSNNAEIVISIIEDLAATINLNTIYASISENDGASVIVYQNNIFQNNWSGKLINNNPGTGDDYALVLIRPISNPLYTYNGLISVTIQAEV